MDIDMSPKLKRNSVLHKSKSVNQLDSSSASVNENCSTTNGPNSYFRIPTSTTSGLLVDVNPELLKLIQEKILDCRCVTLNDVKFFLRDITPEYISNTELSDKCLEECILAAGAEKLQNKWPPNTTPEPLYAITNCGDHLDKFRELLIGSFSKKPKIRSAILRKKIEEDLGEELSNAEHKQLMQEYCVSKAGFCYLKGTIQVDS